jgi:ATP-dependent Lhr-like helicase
LAERGASFFADLVRLTGQIPAQIEDGLWELVAAGLVTADGFDNLRALIDPRRRRAEGRERARRPRHATGRWSLLREARGARHEARGAAALDASSPVTHESSLGSSSTLSTQHAALVTETIARRLLRRYGLVFRDLLVRESLVASWRDLLVAYRRMELKGEVRGGRFVSGFVGEQFALPEAVEALRALRKSGSAFMSQEVRLSACDPLNLAGVILPGPRVPAVPTNFLVVKDGIVVRTVLGREQPDRFVSTVEQARTAR